MPRGNTAKFFSENCQLCAICISMFDTVYSNTLVYVPVPVLFVLNFIKISFASVFRSLFRICKFLGIWIRTVIICTDPNPSFQQQAKNVRKT